jgi:hypothetical protein
MTAVNYQKRLKADNILLYSLAASPLFYKNSEWISLRSLL